MDWQRRNISGGLYDLVSQSASLLADNIITINCIQINARVNTFFTADSEAQAIAGEKILQKQYAGKPYQILRSDLLEKITVNPVADAAGSQKITELIELHNYIIASFFQNIGIKANNTIKRERMITDEIDSQMDFLQINILEILTSWQAGFDKVNEIYGTSFTVRLNPVLVPELLEEAAPAGDRESDQEEAAAPAGDGESDQDEAAAPAGDGESDQDEAAASAGDGESDQEEAAQEPIEEIESKEEIIEDIVDLINDKEEPEEGENDEQKSTEENAASDTD